MIVSGALLANAARNIAVQRQRRAVALFGALRGAYVAERIACGCVTRAVRGREALDARLAHRIAAPALTHAVGRALDAGTRRGIANQRRHAFQRRAARPRALVHGVADRAGSGTIRARDARDARSRGAIAQQAKRGAVRVARAAATQAGCGVTARSRTAAGVVALAGAPGVRHWGAGVVRGQRVGGWRVGGRRIRSGRVEVCAVSSGVPRAIASDHSSATSGSRRQQPTATPECAPVDHLQAYLPLGGKTFIGQRMRAPRRYVWPNEGFGGSRQRFRIDRHARGRIP